MSRQLRIFISHKMPKHSHLAQAIGRKIRSFGGNSITIHDAKDFTPGADLTAEVDRRLADTDMLILLYTGNDEDWSWCLVEVGKFLAYTAANKERQIVIFHDPSTDPPKPFQQYLSVPIDVDSVSGFLSTIYRNDPWRANDRIDDGTLHDAAKAIVGYFSPGGRVRFELVPNFTISFVLCGESRRFLSNDAVPPNATFEGSQRWENLFDRTVDEPGITWATLSSKWRRRDLYEYELARMLKDALNHTEPEGCFIRDRGDNLFRLILRRYEEAIDNIERPAERRLWFYFSASPLDLPTYGIREAEKSERQLFHLINITWFVRRKLVEGLYRDLRGFLLANTASNLGRDQLDVLASLMRQIRDAIQSIDIQSAIRSVGAPADVEESFDAKVTSKDHVKWDTLRDAIFLASKGPRYDVAVVLGSLYEMSEMNIRYYQEAAVAYAATAGRLRQVSGFQAALENFGTDAVGFPLVAGTLAEAP